MTGRAKWDAWKSTGKRYEGKDQQAEERYIEIAKGCGWAANDKPSQNPAVNAPDEEPSAEKLLEAEDLDIPSGGAGMGLVVSTISDDKPIVDVDTLHGYALAGESEKLLQFLEDNPNADLNNLDEHVRR